MLSAARTLLALLTLVTGFMVLPGIPAAVGAQVPGLTGTLVVTNKGPATATIIDIASGRTLATLPTGQGPHEVVVSSDGRTAVVTDYGARRTLTVIDVPGLKIAKTIDLGESRAPHGIVFLPGDRLVAVTAEASRHVAVVDIVDGTVRRVIPTQFGGSHMIGVTADGARGFTGNMSGNTVSELDLVAGTFVRSFAVPATPEAVNVTPDGAEVWVGSNATGRVSVLNPVTGTVTTAADGMRWPYRMLFTPDGRSVVVPDPSAHEIRFIDRATRREISRLSLAGSAPQGVTTTPDGRFLFQSLSRQSRVAVIDLRTRAVVSYVAAGPTPDGVAYTRMVIPATKN